MLFERLTQSAACSHWLTLSSASCQFSTSKSLLSTVLRDEACVDSMSHLRREVISACQSEISAANDRVDVHELWSFLSTREADRTYLMQSEDCAQHIFASRLNDDDHELSQVSVTHRHSISCSLSVVCDRRAADSIFDLYVFLSSLFNRLHAAIELAKLSLLRDRFDLNRWSSELLH